jgi:hypothetical protein
MHGDESIAAGNRITEPFNSREKFLFSEYQQQDNSS